MPARRVRWDLRGSTPARRYCFRPGQADPAIPASREKRDLIRTGLEKRRVALGLTHIAMAEAIGISSSNLYEWYNGNRHFSSETLRKIADWLHRTKHAKPTA